MLRTQTCVNSVVRIDSTRPPHCPSVLELCHTANENAEATSWAVLSSGEPVDDERMKCHEGLYENARSSGLIITRAEMDAGW